MIESLLLIFGWALLCPFFQRATDRLAHYLRAAAPFGAFCYILFRLPTVQNGQALQTQWSWAQSAGINFSLRLDGLSAIFSLLITGIGTLVILYAGPYLKGARNQVSFNSYLLIFLGGMLGLVLANDIVSLYMFWELTGVMSYALIGFKSTSKEARQSALQAFLITTGAGLALLVGLIVLANLAGTSSINELHRHHHQVISSTLYPSVFILIIIGTFAKSAMVPFHFWLPGAMVAPTPVSAFLHSATMVKAGIYLLARLRPTLGETALWHYTLLIVGSLTLLLAGYRLIIQTDIKRILAETTLMTLALLVILLAISGPEAASAFAAFLVAHAIYKAGLFLIAGNIESIAGSRDIRYIKGLAKIMPATAASTAMLALAMIGVPPTLGFVAKELLYGATLTATLSPTLWTVITVVGNALVAYGALTLALGLFLRRAPQPAALAPAKAVPWLMQLVPMLLGIFGITFGVFVGAISPWLLDPIVLTIHGQFLTAPVHLWPGFDMKLALSAITIALGAAAFSYRRQLVRIALIGESLIRWRFATLYSTFAEAVLKLARWQTALLQNGSLRRYNFVVLSIVFFGLFLVLGKSQLTLYWNPHDAGLVEWTIGLVTCVATAIALLAKGRLVPLISIGIVGFGLGVIFVLADAPDLALAQLTVETLLIVAVITTLSRLPSRKVPARTTAVVCRDVVLSLGIGALVSLALLDVTARPFDTKLSAFYAQMSQPVAHGRNIVNTILVDFRALDTLGEITVILAAALSSVAALACTRKLAP